MRRRTMRRLVYGVGTFVALLLTARPAYPQAGHELLRDMLVAEDGRAPGLDALDPILAGLQSDDPDIQRRAVRALGRLERAALVPLVVPLMSAERVTVRNEAVNALGQLAHESNVDRVRALLHERLRDETHPGVRGTLARTIGRLPWSNPRQIAEAEQALLRASWVGTEGTRADAPAETMVGVVHGLASLIRNQRGGHQLAPQTGERLHELARWRPSDSTALMTRRRRLATDAVILDGSVDSGQLRLLLGDPDDEVRRLATRALAADGIIDREAIFQRALADSSPRVRYEALRVYGSMENDAPNCAIIERLAADPNMHVTLLAIDLLGSRCVSTPALERRLMDWAEGLPSSARVWEPTWHRSAHAVLALARISPATAAAYLPRFAGHQNWLVRVYAARAAMHVPDIAVLQVLAGDDHDNVRTEAILGLSSRLAHAADSFYIAALARPDYLLLLTAARALDGSPSDRAVPALLTALRRVTAGRRMTSRDTRLALLNRVAALEGAAIAGALVPYAHDFDPVVAERAAALLTEWTGQVHHPVPEPMPPALLPTQSELAELGETRVRVIMRGGGGGHFDIELYPEESPTNAARFARLVRAGYYDGLTFHRVVPNFVVQGGSPGANEYMGDGPYTRDELGLRSHLRGSVGLSTRGRDTGDAQVFVNLVDNVRLDHNYTIFGAVVAGMETVDAVLEGATMERVTVVPRDDGR